MQNLERNKWLRCCGLGPAALGLCVHCWSVLNSVTIKGGQLFDRLSEHQYLKYSVARSLLIDC